MSENPEGLEGFYQVIHIILFFFSFFEAYRYGILNVYFYNPQKKSLSAE